MSNLLSWNFDTSNIPRDHAVILACGDKSQTVTKSRWSDKRGAWEGLSDGEQPIAWTLYPEHPYKAMAAMSAPQPVKGEAGI